MREAPVMDDDAFVACDACGMRSYFFVLLASGLELSYCGHHGREYTPGLRAKGAIIDDYSKYIGFT